jgi:hypothetical protein
MHVREHSCTRRLRALLSAGKAPSVLCEVSPCIHKPVLQHDWQALLYLELAKSAVADFCAENGVHLECPLWFLGYMSTCYVGSARLRVQS